jgi:ankyrin repeat protein
MMFTFSRPNTIGLRVRATAIAVSILSLWPLAATQASAQGAPGKGDFMSFLEIVKAGNVDAVRLRLDQTPVLLTARDREFGATALHWAAAGGNRAMAMLLMERGADPCAKNSKGFTPSEVAMRNGCTGLAVPMRCPAEPLESLLFTAAKEGDIPTISQLLDLKPTMVNSIDTLGATLLHWAAYKGYAAVTAFLLDNGADATARNLNGKTPLQIAISQQNSLSIVNRSAGPSEGAWVFSAWKPSIGNALMHQELSAQIQQEALTRDVMSRYDAVIRVLEQPEWQRPPSQAVIAAARDGDMVVLRRLLRSNPALTRATDTASGGTPLHAAAADGPLDAVSFLLLQGADVGALDAAGHTALQIARQAGRKEVAELLEASATGDKPAH